MRFDQKFFFGKQCGDRELIQESKCLLDARKEVLALLSENKRCKGDDFIEIAYKCQLEMEKFDNTHPFHLPQIYI